MFLRFALRMGVAGATVSMVIALATPRAPGAQNPAPQGSATKSTDAFGEDTTSHRKAGGVCEGHGDVGQRLRDHDQLV